MKLLAAILPMGLGGCCAISAETGQVWILSIGVFLAFVYLNFKEEFEGA